MHAMRGFAAVALLAAATLSASHGSPPPSAGTHKPAMVAAAATKDAITCHVLDTRIGRPARGIRVRLESADAGPGGAAASFESLTDDDGRISAWLPYSSATSSGEVPVHTLDQVLGAAKCPSRWTLRFETEVYFGPGKTFFPEAVVVFRVDPGQHYHVPLLLSPYSYTTYRGS